MTWCRPLHKEMQSTVARVLGPSWQEELLKLQRGRYVHEL